MRIALVGAGPSNLHLARMLRGYDVHLFEEDNRLGIPLHCTGLVSEGMARLLGIGEKVFVNKYDEVHIAPGLSGKGGVLLRFTYNRVVMLDRPGLENYLYERSSIRYVHLGKRVLDVRPSGFLKAAGGHEDKFDLVVVGEGSRNILNRVLGIELRTLMGIQVDAKSSYLKELIPDEHHIVVLVGTKFSSGFFSWIVPIDHDTFRVGVVDKAPYVKARFRLLSNRLNLVEKRVFGGKVVLGSSTPRYGLGKLAVVGDATGITKSLTGGGIITGMVSSAILAKAIAEDENGNIANVYDRELRNGLGRLAKAYSAISKLLYSNIGLAEYVLSKLDFVKVEIPDYDNHIDAALRILANSPQALAHLMGVVFNLRADKEDMAALIRGLI